MDQSFRENYTSSYCNSITNNNNNSNYRQHHHHHSQYHHHHHRKRNKHLIEKQCDNMDKSSDEEGAGYGIDSDTREAEKICPWKKTRIAREWRQQCKLNDEPTTVVINLCTANESSNSDNTMDSVHMNDSNTIAGTNDLYHAGDDDNDDCGGDCDEDDDAVDDDNDNMDADDDDETVADNLCDCNTRWRRSSSDSNDNVQNDSGCDSDCPENITQLCKKFDKNLSKQNVINIFHFSFRLKSNYLLGPHHINMMKG